MIQTWSKSLFSNVSSILLLTLASACVLFSLYVASIPTYQFNLYNPCKIEYHLYRYGILVVIFSGIGFIVTIGSIVIYYLISEKRNLHVLVTAIEMVSILLAVIFEGVFFNFVDNSMVNFPEGQFYHEAEARRYVKKSLERLYEQAQKNLRDRYPNTDIFNTRDWRTFKQSSLGQERYDDDSNKNKIIQLGDLWRTSPNSEYIIFIGLRKCKL